MRLSLLPVGHAILVGTFLLASFAVAQVSEPFKLSSLFPGVGEGDRAGHAVLAAGDMDGDGFGDILVGLPGASPGGLEGAGIAILYSGRGGFVIRRFDGTEAGGAFGSALAVVPDVNGDGVPDLIIGAPLASVTGLTESGKIYRVSGADGIVLNAVTSDQDRAHFGATLAVPGDLDGDGVSDCLVGAPGDSVGPLMGAGKVFALSGAGMGRLYTVRGEAAGESLGLAIAILPGLIGASDRAYAIGSPGASVGNLTQAGRVQIFRSNGTLLQQLNGSEPGAHFGASLGRAGDLNHDGNGELLVGGPDASPRGVLRAGSAFVVNPSNGLLFLRIDGSVAGQHLGSSETGISDVTGDGTREVAIASYGNGTVPGRISVYSGGSGSLLFERVGDPADGTGANVALAGDVDGDGTGDLVYGQAFWSNPLGQRAGRAVLLTYDRSTLNVSGQPRQGSRLTFTLDADPGDLYILILSTRGWPGSRLTPIPFPTAAGNAVALDVGLENLAVSFTHPGFMGDLDLQGHRVLRVRIPAFSSPPLPVTLTAQFVTYRGAASSIKRMSNAVGLLITQ